MTLTSDDAPDAATTAVVTIRIPAGGDDDLVTCVEARLARATGVTDVTVTELHGVEPKLSATIVTVGVTIGTCSPTADSELRDRLADVPGVESIDRWK